MKPEEMKQRLVDLCEEAEHSDSVECPNCADLQWAVDALLTERDEWKQCAAISQSAAQAMQLEVERLTRERDNTRHAYENMATKLRKAEARAKELEECADRATEETCDHVAEGREAGWKDGVRWMREQAAERVSQCAQELRRKGRYTELVVLLGELKEAIRALPDSPEGKPEREGSRDADCWSKPGREWLHRPECALTRVLTGKDPGPPHECTCKPEREPCAHCDEHDAIRASGAREDEK